MHHHRESRLPVRSADRPAFDLEHALLRIRNEYALRDRVGFRVFVNGQPKPLKPAVLEEIYCIGREALINAFRHSNATDIEVEAEYSARRLRVVIRDNGCGIDPRSLCASGNGHWGLIGMSERAGSIGGELRVWSNSGAGTEVEVSVPCG